MSADKKDGRRGLRYKEFLNCRSGGEFNDLRDCVCVWSVAVAGVSEEQQRIKAAS